MVYMGGMDKGKRPPSCPDSPASILNICRKMFSAVVGRPAPNTVGGPDGDLSGARRPAPNTVGGPGGGVRCWRPSVGSSGGVGRPAPNAVGGSGGIGGFAGDTSDARRPVPNGIRGLGGDPSGARGPAPSGGRRHLRL